MLDKMVGIKIGSTIVILIENKHFEAVTRIKFMLMLMKRLFLRCKDECRVDQLVKQVEASGGRILEQPTVKQGYYGAMFTDPDGHKFNFLVC